MSKSSVKFKVTVLALLVALVLASLPTTNVVAKDTNQGLEKKWDQLVTNFTNQSSHHNAAHKWVDHWLQTHKKASSSEKAEVQKYLGICNSAIVSAGTIVSKHAGFDAEGKLVERASAIRSIKDLSYYLQRHAGSIKNLGDHINK